MMEGRRKRVSFLLAFLCLLLPAVSYGQLITIAITATVTSVTDTTGVLTGNVAVGDTITGTYTYDSTSIDLYSTDSTYAKYLNYNALTVISLNVAGVNFGTNPDNCDFSIAIRNNNLGEDRYSLGSGNNLSLSNGTEVQTISWVLSDSTGTALSSDSLPLAAPNLNSWSSNVLTISTDRIFSISAVVTSAVIVPEPATFLLLSCGLWFTRRSSK